jgi:hypothetical protein
VHVFRQKPTLEDAIGSHACSLELVQACDQWRSSRGGALPLTVTTVNSVQTLKASSPFGGSDEGEILFKRGGGVPAFAMDSSVVCGF